jgi:PASTA domain-containing protein
VIKAFRLPRLPIVIVVAFLALCASAEASIVTVGPSLTSSYLSSAPDNVGTFANSALEAGANLTSPVTGTVVCWSITGATGGPFKLRVLTPSSGSSYTGAGTSAPQMSTGTATQSFLTDLPIKSGQTIGLDDSMPGDQLGFRFEVGTHINWIGSLLDGSTRTGTPSAAGEIGINALVQTAGGAAGEVECGGTKVGGITESGENHCVVPKLKGQKLMAVKKKLKKANCKLGKVTKVEGATASSGRVKKQSPKAGKILVLGSKVKVTLKP